MLYLFLLWVARSALQGPAPAGARAGTRRWPTPTGIHPRQPRRRPGARAREPRLVVQLGPGHEPGMEYDLERRRRRSAAATCEIHLEDPFASTRHARLVRQGGIVVIEDLGSTNGTYLNEELLDGPQPLHPGDRIRIGDSAFTYWD